MNQIANSIRSLRELEGMSQQKLADLVGVTRSAISMYETGSTYPKMAVLQKIAQVFGVSVASMVYDQDKDAAEYGVQMESIPQDEYNLLMCYRTMSPKYMTLLIQDAHAYATFTISERNERNF